MDKSRLLSSRWQSRYDDSFPDIAYKLLKEEEKTISHLCEEFACSDETLRKWRKIYPDLDEAIKQGLECAKSKFSDQQRANLGNKNYNHEAHARMAYLRFRERSEYTTPIAKLKEAKNYIEKMKALEEEVSDGNISAKEAALISKMFVDGIHLENHEVLNKKVDKLEKALSGLN